MEKVQETYDYWTREGTRWYPVLGMRSAEISELLQFAYDVYDDYKDDKQLKGAGVTAERGYFAKTYARYNVCLLYTSLQKKRVFRCIFCRRMLY